MSIPLNQSPFANTLPCKFAHDDRQKIQCSVSSSNCIELCSMSNHCPYFYPVDEFKDNTKHSLHPQWILRSEGDLCWFKCQVCENITEPMDKKSAEYYPYLHKFCNICGTRLYLEDESVDIVEPGIYQHFKGNYYNVICTCKHTETDETLVVYQAMYKPYTIYCRPLKMFVEDVEDFDYKYRGPRFMRCRPQVDVV